MAPADPPVNGKPEIKPAEAKPKVPVWEFLSDPERDADGTATWLYRLYPVISRQQGEHAILKRRGRFDREDILREFGSGTYMVQVNSAAGKHLYTETCSFHNPDMPPRVNIEEVVKGDPRNDSFFATWGKKTTGGDVLGNRDSGKGEAAEILREYFQRGPQVDPSLMTLFQDTAKQRDELARLLAEKKPEAPPPPPPLDVLGIIAQIKSLQPDTLAVLERLKNFFPERERKEASAPPPNSLEELKKLLEVFGQAKSLLTPETPPAAAAAGPDAEVWEKVAVNISGQAASILNAAPAIIMALKTKAAAAAPGAAGVTAAGAMGPQTVFDPYQMSSAALRNFAQASGAATTSGVTPNPAAGPTGNSSSPATESPAGSGQPPSAAGQPDEMLVQIVALVNQALSCLNREIDGRQAAAAVCDLNGQLYYDSLVAQISTVGIPASIELTKQIPELRSQVITYEVQLRQFIAEFVQGPWDDEDAGTPAGQDGA
jgi:hypothetical protein